MFVTLTVAPVTAAPVGSVTVPLMVPNSPCALVWCGHSTNRRSDTHANNEAIFAGFIAPSLNDMRRSGRRRFPKIGFQPAQQLDERLLVFRWVCGSAEALQRLAYTRAAA